MKIFIANLHHSATTRSLRELFEPFGEVVSASLVLDKFTARSRGAGHVVMREQAAGAHAIAQLHNSRFMQQCIGVREVSIERIADFV